MDQSLLNIAGFYEPGFLHLQVDTEEDISDFNALRQDPEKRRLFSTIIHEYVHFLQDITTTSGLFKAIHYIDILKEATNTIRESESQEFVVPFAISNQFNIQANDKFQIIYRGDSDAVNFVSYLAFYVDYEQVADKDDQVYTAKKYRVLYRDLTSRRERSLYFGTTCLKEYIAHEIQTKYCPEVEHPDIPYAIAGLILDQELPVLTGQPMLKVAFCDACLMFTHPAQLFFDNIERLKQLEFNPQSCREVYDIIWADLKFSGQGEEHTVVEFYQKINKVVKDQFKDALKSDIFGPNRQWLEYLFSVAYDLRLQIPDFICHLIGEDGELAEDFAVISRGLGWPLFTNKNWQGKFIPPQGLNQIDIQPYQLLVFKEIIKVFKGSKSCGLYQFCNNSQGRVSTNEHCTTAPWMRVHDKDLCPFAQFWKTWGMATKTPVTY